MSNQDQEKKKLQIILQKELQINESIVEAKKRLESHIGFEEEKEKFADDIYLYLETKGNFWPLRSVICFAGAPGTGKTTFVETIKEATGRELHIVPCAGLEFSEKFSILGDKSKPSLIARAIIETGCKNPIILFDELEKVKDEQIQKDLLELFNRYEKKGYKFIDPYFQEEIELGHLTFFTAVNYPQDLALSLKNKVNMRNLKSYTREEKEKILQLKSEEIHQKYGVEEGQIIPPKIIKLLPNYIQEDGVRQTERVLYKIEKEYLAAQTSGKTFSLGDPQQ
jgi:ATP-dependent Lon protease